MRPAILRVTPAALLALAGAAHAQQITDLGVLPGTTESAAAAVSADGSAVVGASFTGVDIVRAFRWTVAGGIQDLGVLPGDTSAWATAVNADGTVVVGVSRDLWPQTPFRWTPGGGIQAAWPQGGWSGDATGVSADGSVMVGTAHPAESHAYHMVNGQIMLLNNNYLFNYAYGVSADGAVLVGLDAPAVAFRWSAGTGIQHLGTLQPTGFSVATAVSGDGGTITGSATIDGAPHLIRWREAGGLQGLGILAGSLSTEGSAVNADGTVIVGAASVEPGQFRAIMHTDALGIVDLNEHAPTLGVNLEGWVLTGAAGVSGDGRVVVGEGLFRGVRRGYRLKLPESCYANCDASSQSPVLNIADFTCFLQKFAAGAPYANCDQSTISPVLNVADFGCYLIKFAAGCE